MSKQIKTWCLPSVQEWTLKPDHAAAIVTEIASQLSLHPLILIVGAGYSALPKMIFDAGLTNLVVSDIDQNAVAFQKARFNSLLVKIVCDDILNTSLSCDKYAVIIDASLTDVFIRAKSNARKVLTIYETLLAPNGVIITFSIFLKPWKRLTSAKWTSCYSVVEQFVGSKTRTNIKGRLRSIGIFLHQRPFEYRLFTCSIKMQLLKNTNIRDMPLGAEDM